MTGSRRERAFLVGSGVVLLIATVAGIWMLLRARAIWSGEEDDAERAALLERRDELRGQVAEIAAGNVLGALPHEHASAEELRDALRDAARRHQEDPLAGNPDHAAFGCVALEVSSGADGVAIWTSGPLAAGDRGWCLGSLAAGGADLGTRHGSDQNRIKGLAWRAFEVGGQARVGALFWMTPRVVR